MLIVVSVFAQDPVTKPDKVSQPTPAEQPHRVRVDEDVQKARLVHTVSPLYPPLTGKRMDGTVVLHVVIGKSGAVKSAKYVSGLPNLMNSAINAVLQWRYKPTFVNGVAVEVDSTVSVVFPPLGKQETPMENK
jgi:protein TonB